jgi:methylphosphotriester-DNA--protein-cysteine methyltransferase
VGARETAGRWLSECPETGSARRVARRDPNFLYGVDGTLNSTAGERISEFFAPDRCRLTVTRQENAPAADCLCQTSRLSPGGCRNGDDLFQRHLGRGIREEIQQVRLNLVQQFLVETNLPVWKIAEIAGFNQLAYLSRVFHRETGMTLLQYRRKHRKS